MRVEETGKEILKEGREGGGQEGKAFVCKEGGERTLLGDDRDAETESSHSANTARESQTGFCLPSCGHCQTSVSVARCFVSAIIRHLSGLRDKP